MSAERPLLVLCALDGCDRAVEPPQRRYCTGEHRRLAEQQRRAARLRAEAAASLAARQDALIATVERLYYLAPAARAVGIDPSTAYEWARRDPEFAERFTIARQVASDAREIDLLQVATAQNLDMNRLRAAEAVCRRIDANEKRRRAAEARAEAARSAPALPEPDLAGALEWAEGPHLEAV